MVLGVKNLEGITKTLQDLDQFFLDKLLDGEKLYLDPQKPEEALLIEQIHNFYPDDFDKALDRALDSPPKMYYVTPDLVGTELEKLRLEASTKIHPLHETLIDSQEIFLRNCSKLNGIHNVVMAGGDLHYRDRRDFDKLFARSENLFLHKRGDVVSLSQAVKLLRNVLEGNDNSERSIILDNTSERFTPVLKMLGLDTSDGVDRLNDSLKQRGSGATIGVVDVVGTGIGKLHELGVNTQRKLPVLPSLFEKDLFFDTSSDEKVADTIRTLRANRVDLTINHANLVVGHSEHDAEFTWSFAGNAYAKGVTTLKDKLANPQLDESLEKLGKTRQNAFLLFADGGEYYEDKAVLRDADSLAFVKNVTHPDAEYPGPETKLWSQGFLTKEATYDALGETIQQLEKSLGRKVSRRSIDNCVSLVIPLQQEDIDNPRYYAVKASTMMNFVSKPSPANHVHRTQRHFQRFDGCDETLADMEEDNDARIENLAISRAMRSLAKAARVPKSRVNLKADFNAVRDLEVVCPWPVEDLERANLSKQMEMQGLKLKVSEKPVESFDDIRRVMNKSKAIIFPNVITGEKENFWMSRILLPASILVGKQLRDPKVNGNPMVILSELPERCEFEQILDHLKKSGMITQDMHFLYNRATKPTSAMRFIKEQAQSHVKYEEYQHHKYQELPPVERAIVSYLLSASSAAKVDNDNAYKGAVNCALNGFGLSSGMGSGAPMGWHVKGGLQAIREGFYVDVQGVQDPHAMKTEGWPEKEMLKFMGQGHAVVAPDIFVRILQILETEKLKQNPDMEKIVVAQANGIGGLQEIASFLALKEAGVAGTERTSLIIENTPRQTAMASPYDPNDAVYRPHDALIDLLDRRGELHADNGIFVTKDPRETNDLIGKLTGKEMIYYDVERPADTLYPFAREKNEFYDWFMHPEENHKAPPKTIRQVYDEVRRGVKHTPEMAFG